MTEITEKKAGMLMPDDVRCLLHWRDNTHEAIVYGIPIQGLLDLYHASEKFVSLEGWLDEDPKAPQIYRKITGRSLEDCA